MNPERGLRSTRLSSPGGGWLTQARALASRRARSRGEHQGATLVGSPPTWNDKFTLLWNYKSLMSCVHKYMLFRMFQGAPPAALGGVARRVGRNLTTCAQLVLFLPSFKRCAPAAGCRNASGRLEGVALSLYTGSFAFCAFSYAFCDRRPPALLLEGLYRMKTLNLLTQSDLALLAQTVQASTMLFRPQFDAMLGKPKTLQLEQIRTKLLAMQVGAPA
jgi:hypothetical protein